MTLRLRPRQASLGRRGPPDAVSNSTAPYAVTFVACSQFSAPAPEPTRFQRWSDITSIFNAVFNAIVGASHLLCELLH